MIDDVGEAFAVPAKLPASRGRRPRPPDAATQFPPDMKVIDVGFVGLRPPNPTYGPAKDRQRFPPCLPLTRSKECIIFFPCG